MRVGITGASGLIGNALLKAFSASGDEALRFVRPGGSAEAPGGSIAWDPAAGVLLPSDIEGLDAIVHLAGENLASGRWTDERKRRILASRVDGTSLVARTIAKLGKKKPVLVSASGSNYYGDAGDTPCDETSPRGDGFLAEVCEAWERATAPAAEAGGRVVNLRIAMVLSGDGGAIAKMRLPFQLGLGGRIGTGKQWMSWITIDDLVRVVRLALERSDVHGPVNTAAPGAVTNREFTAALARVLSRPSVLPLPAFAVRAMFGEMGEQVLLGGQRLVPAALSRLGFTFAHDTLEPALRHVLRR